MRNIAKSILISTAAAALMLSAGCGQDDITLPDAGGSANVGECGAWYPGGDGDGGASYGFEVGDTLPCLVWESVRKGAKGAEPNTYLNMGDIYLQAKHGETEALQAKFGIEEPKAIVIGMSAENCASCQTLYSQFTDQSATPNPVTRFEELGAILIGVCNHDLLDEEKEIDLETADEILMDHDGWLEEWHRTNDAEGYLPSVLYPSVIVVRLSDMKITASGDGTSFDGIDKVFEALENLNSN